MCKTYIKYNKDDKGPYVKKFDTNEDAMTWLRNNEVQVLSIDFIDEECMG